MKFDGIPYSWFISYLYHGIFMGWNTWDSNQPTKNVTNFGISEIVDLSKLIGIDQMIEGLTNCGFISLFISWNRTNWNWSELTRFAIDRRMVCIYHVEINPSKIGRSTKLGGFRCEGSQATVPGHVLLWIFDYFNNDKAPNKGGDMGKYKIREY